MATRLPVFHFVSFVPTSKCSNHTTGHPTATAYICSCRVMCIGALTVSTCIFVCVLSYRNTSSVPVMYAGRILVYASESSGTFLTFISVSRLRGSHSLPAFSVLEMWSQSDYDLCCPLLQL